MRVTAKGQVTIPRHLREKAGFLPGAQVEFQEENGRLYIRKVAGPGAALVEQMRGRGTVGMTTDDILDLTRGPRGKGGRR